MVSMLGVIRSKKFLKHLDEMLTYIRNKRQLILNYGEKWCYGETISTDFVESTVNEVVSKRLAKKQQMQWTAMGAHFLLQTRTVVLKGELENNFERWHTGFRTDDNTVEMKEVALIVNTIREVINDDIRVS